MPDSLRRLVEKRDREHARPSRLEPERLMLPKRPSSRTRQICADCRRVPQEAIYAAWLEKFYACTSREEREALPDWRMQLAMVVACPCGGQLIEVTL